MNLCLLVLLSCFASTALATMPAFESVGRNSEEGPAQDPIDVLTQELEELIQEEQNIGNFANDNMLDSSVRAAASD
jgi:hypothetical protein